MIEADRIEVHAILLNVGLRLFVERDRRGDSRVRGVDREKLGEGRPRYVIYSWKKRTPEKIIAAVSRDAARMSCSGPDSK